MISPHLGLRDLASDLKTGILFSTRFPYRSSVAIQGHEVARASWAMPVAGTLVGIVGSFTYWLAFQLGLSPPSAAMLALMATLTITGGLHEDGLADTIDGFGGGMSRERKLAIMRDSHIGTFGVCALLTSFILRWSALVAIAEPSQVAMALVAAHVSARATLPALMRLVPPARDDGLSAQAGRPPWGSVIAAVVLGTIALAISLGSIGTIVGLLLLSFAGIIIAWLTVRQIGGQTGDVLGALEQTGEILILLTAAALYRA
jgi:adenosylcobinamide-GDP ribazoletransferase